MEMKMINDKCIWEECDDEDDLFYEELRKQILLLIAEDDEDHVQGLQGNMLKTLKKRFNNGPVCYYNWSGNEATGLVPTWLFDLWKPGNGTGVFIPQIIKSGKRYKPRRKNNERGRIYKPVSDM
ncbi:hypothetical protein M9H77_09561 [Catharanthus roseus]|uniref:Uncharacterized protein n=1 Tax=Catharanthus roseus TaxID=4058 RepID=A0ACC0C1E4_CATRO|nr:hypothetical protein M9H77_09561 [Catharanthus roseus]